MMIKIINLMLVLIFSISFISALTIYSGETIELELEKPFEYYSIVGNSSEVILDVVQDGNNVTIIPDKYSPFDSYEIIFFDINKEVIVNQYSSGGGGGGGGRIVYRNQNTTQSINNETIIYVDKEVEVEKIVKEVPLWALIIMGLAGLIIIIISFYKSQNTSERRYENNEQENYVGDGNSISD